MQQETASQLAQPALETRKAFSRLSEHLNQSIVGQQKLIEQILIAVLADGHLMVEGAPGLAKTTAIKALASAVKCDYHRVQFTPDLLPADLTGTEVYRPEDGSFHFDPGPIFHNIVLADEINRAPAKVQSALLEAMAERQVTIGRKTYPLPPFFLVMATQNPIEQEGTYPLPEAQLDRFLLYTEVGYPDAEAERQVLELVKGQERGEPGAVDSPSFEHIPQTAIISARRQVSAVHVSEGLAEYIVQLILATRNPGNYSDALARWISWGASPRGTIALEKCARARAWLHERDYVTPEDVHSVAGDVLRHRILLSYEAEAEGVRAGLVIDDLLKRVPLP